MRSLSTQVRRNSLPLWQLVKTHIPLPLDRVFMSALVCVFPHVFLGPLEFSLGSSIWS